jgi:hypothetical protein
LGFFEGWFAAAAWFHPASTNIQFFDSIDVPTHHQPSAKPRKEIRFNAYRGSASSRAAAGQSGGSQS